MSLIPLTCPLCAGVFQVDAAHAGSQVQCPHCTKAVTIPAELAQPAAVSQPTQPIQQQPATSSPAPAQAPGGQPDMSPPSMPDVSPPAPVDTPPSPSSSDPPAQATFSFPAPPPIPGTEPATTSSAAPEPTAAADPPLPADSAPPPNVVETPQPSEPVSLQRDEPTLARLSCDNCENPLRVPLEAAGGQVHCPTCNAVVDVPATLVEAPDVPDADEIVAPEYQFEDPDETADDVVEQGGIRHLTREERAKIRARKNLFMLVAGFLLLFGVTYLLQRYETFFMDLYDRIVPESEEVEEE